MIEEIKPETSELLDIPHFSAYETDGGKLSARRSNIKYSHIGSPLKASKKALDKANQDGIDLTKKVTILPSALNDAYFFNPHNTVTPFDGVILINYNLITGNYNEHKN